jgi:hypothetical protein
MDTVPGNRVQDKVNSQSTISRFACRIIAQREGEDDDNAKEEDEDEAETDNNGACNDGDSAKKLRVEREGKKNGGLKARIYAAGFDSSRNIFLGRCSF